MSSDRAAPLPDYFELLRAMMGGQTTPAALTSAMPGMTTLDPAEFDKKIRELEIIHMWLQAQANAVDLSIKGMQYQRDMLQQLGTARENAQAALSSEDMAKFAAAFNPGAWMSRMVPTSAADSPAARVATPRTSSRKNPKAGKKL